MIKLSFTPLEIADIVNAQGEILPNCCAHISSARDLLIQAFRNDSWIFHTDLNQICEELLSCSEVHHPKIQQLFELNEEAKKSEDYPEIDTSRNSLKVLMIYCGSLLSELLFCAKKIGNKKEDEKYKNICKSFYKMKIYPFLKELLAEMQNEEPVTGFACFKDDQLIEMNSGPAIFPTEKLAKNFQKFWPNEQIQIEPVKISIEKGVVKTQEAK